MFKKYTKYKRKYLKLKNQLSDKNIKIPVLYGGDFKALLTKESITDGLSNKQKQAIPTI